jgi:hypothetical protein
MAQFGESGLFEQVLRGGNAGSGSTGACSPALCKIR